MIYLIVNKYCPPFRVIKTRVLTTGLERAKLLLTKLYIMRICLKYFGEGGGGLNFLAHKSFVGKLFSDGRHLCTLLKDTGSRWVYEGRCSGRGLQQ